MPEVGSPLIPNKSGQTGVFKPDPTYQAKIAREQSDADWNYWQQALPHAVEFAKAAIRTEMTDAEKQAVLLATLTTMEAWLRQEPAA